MKARMLGTVVLSASLMFTTARVQDSTFAQPARGFLTAPGAKANPGPNRNCRKISANGIQFFDPATGIISGPVTNSGLLDGDLTDVINFGAGFAFTPDPTVVAYTTDFTITTIQGQLKASAVTTQSIITGQGAEWGQINPNTSTGRYAGATGMISVVFKAVGDPAVGPYEAQITADICFAQ
jgi:hypothetical protein